jgi:hypothetical protein
MNLKQCKEEKATKFAVPGIVARREFPVAWCEQGVVSMWREAEGAGRRRCGHVCTRARLDAFRPIQTIVDLNSDFLHSPGSESVLGMRTLIKEQGN